MIKKVTQYVSKWNMLEKEDKVIAGVSGGADSVCLLFMLLELRKKIGFEIIAVHVNHQLRGEDAFQDEEYVKKLCARENIVCEIYYKNVELIAEKRKQSIEEAGRNARREAFTEALNKYGATKIALAHHKNDNVETLVMNLARGSGLRGLGGIKPVSGNIVRPLLCLQRKQIEGYLESRGIVYCTDETNASDDYTRNRIRNHIIPSLENEVNEKAVEHISETMEMLRDIQDYMSGEMKRYYKDSVAEDNGVFLILKGKFCEIPEVLQGSVIKEVIAVLAGAEKDIHSSHIKSVKELMEKQTGREINLPYRITAKRCYEGVRLVKNRMQRAKKVPEEQIIDFSEDGEIRIKDMKLSYRTVMPKDIGEGAAEKTYTKCFDYDIIKGSTTVVRTRAPGDYITIDKNGRTQKLKSYFINEKIPQEKRDDILLLAEGSHILWVIGYRRGYAYHVGEKTKEIVEIKIDKGENSDGRNN